MLVYASGQCMEQRSCGCSQLWQFAPPGMAVGCCELRLRSTPRNRLVCICFPTPGRGLPYGSGLGLSRCLGPGECLYSLNDNNTIQTENVNTVIITQLLLLQSLDSVFICIYVYVNVNINIGQDNNNTTIITIKQQQ